MIHRSQTLYPELPVCTSVTDLMLKVSMPSFHYRLLFFSPSVDGASSIAASVRLERTLSDEAASVSVGRLSIPAALALQAKLWLCIGEKLLLRSQFSGK